MQQDLSLNLISEKLGYATSYLSTIFKQTYGIPFINYLIEVRLEAAKHLLITTDKSISQIALEIGYTSNHGFIRTFKKYVGVSPAEFRQNHTNI